MARKNLNHDLIINSSGDANNPSLRINNASSNTYNHSIESFNSNLTSGETELILVGKEGSTKNSGYIGYYWTAAGSNNNFVSLGSWSADHLFRVYGDQVLSTVTLRGNVDMQAPIFYDKDNTGYYVDPAGTSAMNDINLDDYIVHTGDTDTYFGFTAANQISFDAGGTTRFRIEGDVKVLGTTDFNIQGTSRRLQFTAGTGTVRTTTANNLILQTNNTTRQTITTTYSEEASSYRAPIFYDSNNTNYYVNPDDRSSLWEIFVPPTSSATDGARIRTYAWNDPNWGFSTFASNPNYHVRVHGYGNAHGTDRQFQVVNAYASNAVQLAVNFDGTGTAIGAAGTESNYKLTVHGSVHMKNNEINYVNQLHFNDNVRFFDTGADNYLAFKWGDANHGGIRFQNGGDTVKGYVYGDNGGFGLLDKDGHWVLQTNGTSFTALRANDNEELIVYTDRVEIPGDIRAPYFYDRDDTGYYLNPAGASNIGTLNVQSVNSSVGVKSPNQRTNYVAHRWAAGNTFPQAAVFDGSFQVNGGSDENTLSYGTTPSGGRGLLWKAENNDTSSGADGGWAKNISNLSDDKSYISICYVKRVGTSTNGSFYHGCHGSHTLNMNGTDNTNPYFIVTNIGNLTQDVWCVSIGIIQANNDSNTGSWSDIDGVYRLDTGERILDASTFKMKDGSTSQSHRTYLYYSTDSSAELHWYNPGFYEINGQEPSLNEILNRDKHFKFNGNLNVQGTTNFSGAATFAASVSSPIFYDSNDTSYYVNPAGDSQMNQIHLADYVRHLGDLDTYFGFNGADQWKLHIGGGDRVVANTSTLTSNLNFQAPIFYDSNDTNYYVNPAGGAVIQTLTIDDYIYHKGDTNTYLYFENDSIKLRTGGTDRLVLNDYEAYFERPVVAPNLGRNNDDQVLFAITEQDTSETIRRKFGNTGLTAITKVDDSTAPADGCFQLTDQYENITIPQFFKVDDNSEYTFEVWVKFVSGSDTDQKLYAGCTFYDSSKTSLGNTQRYWGESGEQIDSNSRQDGNWYHFSGTLGPNRGSNTGDIHASAQWMKLILLLNYADNANTVRYCGLKFYKSGGRQNRMFTSIYRKSLGSQAGSADSWLGRTVMDTSGNLYTPEKLIHSDDTDTYFSFSAENQISLVAAGTTRLRVEGDVKVLGTTDLNIQGTSRRLQFTAGTGTVRTTTDNNLYLEANNITRQTISTGGYSQEAGSYRAPIFYDSNATAYYIDPTASTSINVSGNAYLGRHVDAVLAWDGTGNSRKALFLGWYGDKVILGNNDDGGHDTAYNFNDDAVISVNPFYSYMDITSRTALRSPIFYDSNDTNYYVDPANTNLSVKVYGEISNSNYVAGNLQPGSLNIGRTDTDYAGITTWSSDVKFGILANCNNNWEFGIHDSAASVESVFLYQNTNGLITMGRDVGWGTTPIVAANSFRAPIFYDSDNTGYYTNPNGTSVMSALTLGSTFTQNGGDFITHGTQTGDLNSFWQLGGTGKNRGIATGRFQSGASNSFTSANNANWIMNIYSHAGSGGAYPYGIQLGGTDTGDRNLMIRGISNGTFGSWARVFHENSSDLRSPIFYDSADTTYYVDPNSGSQSGLFKGNLRFNNYGAGIVGLYSATKYQLVFAMGDAYKGAIDGSNVTGGYGLWYSHPNAGGVAANLSNHGLMNIANGTWHASLASSTRASVDMRAPIFYDLADSNYYVDPANTGTAVYVKGDVVAYGASDERLKDNIKPIDNALDKVCSLSGNTFEWNEISHRPTGKKDIGVIAQEVEKVFPEIVDTRDSGYKAVYYEKLTAILIEAVKELKEEVKELKDKCNGCTK